MDGNTEKNTHATVAGRNFPTQMKSVYVEKMESGAKRDADLQESTKIKQTKILNNNIKDKIRKDSLQNLIYELKAREERFEQTSRAQNDKGLGYPTVSLRGNSFGGANNRPQHDPTTMGKRERYQISLGLAPGSGIDDAARRDARFNLPTSIKGEYAEQLLATTELTPEIRQSLAANPRAKKLPQRKFKSQYRKHIDDAMSKEV